MNWNAIIALSEVVGVIAIISSLIYVAAQIRQNTLIARATIIHSTNTAATRIPELIAQDAELAIIYRKGISGQSLDGVDLERFIALVEMYVIWLEDVDSQFDADLYFNDDDLDGVIDAMSYELMNWFSTPEVRKWWHQEAKQNYVPGFAIKMDKYIETD
ncbi:hypothetical protein RGQ13_19930 [Thalassotalea psychrophila]|uniref:DUF4760 domain-containing protein n=1 Tax=Thalassotalea psychrophila TaxID=3065647 RepID=A0ABY9TU71_9GAMM|nr:hypothetical protein RGQ13_19930 [Colwelliaceae bacterium SQ149]